MHVVTGNGLVSAPSAAAPSGAVAVATKAGVLRCQAPNIYRIDNNNQRRVGALSCLASHCVATVRRETGGRRPLTR